MKVPSINNRFAEALNNEEVEYGNSPEGESPKNYGGRAIRAAIWDCSMLVVGYLDLELGMYISICKLHSKRKNLNWLGSTITTTATIFF